MEENGSKTRSVERGQAEEEPEGGTPENGSVAGAVAAAAAGADGAGAAIAAAVAAAVTAGADGEAWTPEANGLEGRDGEGVGAAECVGLGDRCGGRAERPCRENRYQPSSPDIHGRYIL